MNLNSFEHGVPGFARRFTSLMGVLAVCAFASDGLAQNGQALPCQADGHYDAFDFWIGDWDVYVSNGSKAGTNRIREIEGGCILLESWTGASGGTGTSVNYYDPSTGKWNQLWVSSNGVVIRISGGLRDGAMVLEGELIGPKGKTQPFRGTWTPNEDGSVRQFFEISADDGATWTSWFDGRYVRNGKGTD